MKAFLHKLTWRVGGMLVGTAVLFLVLAIEGVSYEDKNIDQGVLAGMIAMGVIMIIDYAHDELEKLKKLR